MRRFFLCGLAAAAAIALAAQPAQALRIALPNATTKQKTLQADAVVVGKVTGIDKETVELEPFPGQPKQAYTVANIKVESGLLGAKNVTHVKLAFIKPGDEVQPGGGPVGPGGGIAKPLPFPGRGGVPQYVPAEDQEGVFFLSKHPTSDKHYVVQFNQNPLLSTDPNYKDEVEKVKAMAATFADPVKALKAEKEEERVANALSLAQKYRSYPQNNVSGVTEDTPIPAEETKLLLKVLCEADWVKTADAPRLADALGLVPGNYGIPAVKADEKDEPLAARQKAFKAWADKYGDKVTLTRISAKPITEKPQAPRGGTGGGIGGTVTPGGPATLPAIPPKGGR